MNTEQKAKAYDKALKQAKELLNSPRTCFDIDQLKDIFPQLRESEDERIRKEIINYLNFAESHNLLRTADYEKKKGWLSYLEKQKELDKMIVVSPEVWDNAISDAFENGKKEGKKQKEQKLNPSNSVGLEQKPAEWSEKHIADIFEKVGLAKIARKQGNYALTNAIQDAMLELSKVENAEWSEDYQEENIQTRFAFYTYKDDPSTLYLSNVFVEEASRNHGFGTRILRAAEKVAETIGATTISLKVKQDSPANAWYRKNGYGYVAFEDGYDWLEKNLEYLKPVKQEWSDEDERMRNQLIYDVEYHKKEGLISAKQNKATKALYNGIEKCYDEKIAWLKSLPLSLKKKNDDVAKLCSNEWSKEDEKIMKTLLDYYEKALDNYTCVEWLNGITYGELCDWLKSLRPQPRKEIYQAAKHDLVIKFMNYLDENRPEGKMSLSNGECEDIDKG